MENLKTGDFVKVIKNSANASDFTMLFKECEVNGVYGIQNWLTETFQVCGEKVSTNFEYEELIGKKVKGFSFESIQNRVYFVGAMNDYIGEVGVINDYYSDSNVYSVKFDLKTFEYPADQIEAYLVDEEKNLIQYEEELLEKFCNETLENEIPTLSDGVMMLVSDDGKNYYERRVLGTKNGLCYVWNEYQLETFIYYKPLEKEPTKEEQLTAILGNSDKVKQIMEVFNCKE